MSQNVKKSIRDKLLAGKAVKGKEFEVDGMKLTVKSPTRGERQAIIAQATVDGVLQPVLLETWATIKLTQVAETKEFVFGDEDVEVIQNLETGTVFDEVAAEAVKMLIGEQTDPKG